MTRAVRFDSYGGPEVLYVAEVEVPTPAAGQVRVEVRAAGINPGEAAIRVGALDEQWPATFPSGQGSDLAGVIESVFDEDAGWAAGDEVIGWTDRRASQAELAIVDADKLARKPAGVSWEAAGALFVVGTTAFAAVRAVAARTGTTVVVSGAAGGVGSVTVQLAVHAGATVIGLASDANHEWLRGRGVTAVAYGDGVAQRIRHAASDGVDAFIDCVGSGYVDLALALGIAPERIDTIIDFAAVQDHGVKSEGSAAAASAEVLSEIAGLVDSGEVEIPIAATFSLDQVRGAYEQLDQRHTRGKIVLIP